MDNPSKDLIAALSKVLADSYTLYLQTHNFHWNVTGPNFQSLHLLFEQQYTELALAVDEIAERIRTLGATAPGTYAQFARLTGIEEVEGTIGADEMLKRLIAGQDQVIGSAREAAVLAEQAGDQATADLLVGRIALHQKNGWMLRSSLP